VFGPHISEVPLLKMYFSLWDSIDVLINPGENLAIALVISVVWDAFVLFGIVKMLSSGIYFLVPFKRSLK
jgi:hypothetical protein